MGRKSELTRTRVGEIKEGEGGEGGGFNRDAEFMAHPERREIILKQPVRSENVRVAHVNGERKTTRRGLQS